MTLSPKQASFIQSLLRDRRPDEHLAIEAGETAGGGDKRVASGMIERLLNAPRDLPARDPRDPSRLFGGVPGRTAADEVRVTEPGVYRLDGEVFIVKPNREKTKLYAKRLVEIGGTRVTETDEHVNIEFEYAPGAIYRLSPEDRMPLEDAKALTARYGRCIVCGRHLKDATSVERGIGPVCIRYFADSAQAHERLVMRANATIAAEMQTPEFAAALAEVTS